MLAKPRDFMYVLEPSNPHSIMLIWASNAYARINNLMRNYSLSTIYQEAPSAFQFIKLVIKYFETYGISKEQLIREKQVKVLYRGTTGDIAKQASYVERGFMSTSWKRSVAERFALSATEKGTLQCFSTSQLPLDIKVVIIDTSLASYLNEEEVLFMPGIIEMIEKANGKGACTKCKYTLNEKLINSIKTAPMPKQKKLRGGDNTFNFEKMLQDAMGMTLVYYRARYQQPIEIFDRLDIPTTWDDVIDTVRFKKVKMEQYFTNINEFIPEYVALRKKMQDTIDPNPESSHIMKILNGYEMYPALYDPKTKQVLTTHFLLPDNLFYSMFDKNREQDVIKAVQKECEKWNFTNI